MSPFKLSASGSVFLPHALKQNCVIKCYFNIYFIVQKPTSEHFLLKLKSESSCWLSQVSISHLGIKNSCIFLLVTVKRGGLVGLTSISICFALFYRRSVYLTRAANVSYFCSRVKFQWDRAVAFCHFIFQISVVKSLFSLQRAVFRSAFHQTA